MKIAIINENVQELKSISDFCLAFSQKNDREFMVYEYFNPKDFLESLTDNQYSLVFIDMDFQDKTVGPLLSEELKTPNEDRLIVYTSASRKNMMHGYSCHIFSYMLKPIKKKMVEQLLMEAMMYIKEVPKRIKIMSDRREKYLNLSDIMAVVSDSHYIEVFMKSGEEHRTRLTIADFCDIINFDKRFFYINKGILVNGYFIVEINDSGCKLADGTVYPLKVRGRANVEKEIEEFMRRKKLNKIHI